MDEEATLTSQEVEDLVLSILEGVDFVEAIANRGPAEHLDLRDSWPMEMCDWCLTLLDRIHGQGGDM